MKTKKCIWNYWKISNSNKTKYRKNTLIFFDEIQNSNNALNTLKYFCENAKELYVVAAGSFLGLELAKGFPVGKVDFLKINPMTFFEFLIANNNQQLYEFLLNINEIQPIPDIFFNEFLDQFLLYLTIGGMPEPIQIWTKEKNINLVDVYLQNILNSYQKDFGKHNNNNADNIFRHDVYKINEVFNSLPSQLFKENKKFFYSLIKNSARAREYENALYG